MLDESIVNDDAIVMHDNKNAETALSQEFMKELCRTETEFSFSKNRNYSRLLINRAV